MGLKTIPSGYKVAAEPVLNISNLGLVWPNGSVALKNLDLEIHQGEFVVVIGLSGSGKSTLLRCINRLVEPTSGRVMFKDDDITAASERELKLIRREISMIFQQFNLVKRLDVLTNVLTGKLGYIPPWWCLFNRFKKQHVEEAFMNLKRVGLEQLWQNRASDLSGGQQQRVAIARALMQRPQMMLADEPVASLDPATSHSVMKYLVDVNRKEGLTVLCSLHFLSLARDYGTRIIALKDGELVFDGLPEEIDDKRFKEIYGEDAVEVEIH